VTDVKRRSIRESSKAYVVFGGFIGFNPWDFSFTNKIGICERPGQKEHLSSYQQVDMDWKGKVLAIVEAVNNKHSYVK